ncbi:MAG: hypothetical protein KatS3mg024_2015 [Armatimonadota bacterium]|nr:MAG: hypothetical protein KatS3mg024_2015 [Armatimonadota bacterium]
MSPVAGLVRVSRFCMATRFEIALYGAEADRLRAAGEAALEEVEAAERLLSCFRPESDLSAVNAGAAAGPVRVDPRLFALLQMAQEVWRATGGAFDPTVGPLMRLWGFRGGTFREPSPQDLERVRLSCGMHLIELDAQSRTVRFLAEGVQLDSGAIGKGYALDRAAMALRECGAVSALAHGGTSTAVALGSPPDEPSWAVRIAVPGIERDGGPVVRLKDAALSVSGVHGRTVEWEGRVAGHVLDPRTGLPVEGALLAAVTGPDGARTDAWSTALLVLGESAFTGAVQLPADFSAAVWLPDGRMLARGHAFET